MQGKNFDKLYFLTNSKDINLYFEENKIDDYQIRIDILKDVMNIKEVFCEKEKKMPIKDRYKDMVAIFEEGSWRLF